MAKPTAARLRHRVRFERRGQGASSVSDATDGGAWAEVVPARSACLEPTRGSEQVIAGRLQGTAAFDLWVRYDSGTRGVKPGDRVVDVRDPTRTFNVRWAEDLDGERTWILMQVESGVADG